MKHLWLLCLVALGILVVWPRSEAQASHPTVCDPVSREFDRCYFDGYFTGVSQGTVTGTYVWPDGMTTVNNAADFITLTQTRLYTDLSGCSLAPVAVSASCQSKKQLAIGAAFIIESMLGAPGTSFSGVTEGIARAKVDFSKWVDLITLYETNGWVEWNTTRLIPDYSTDFYADGEFRDIMWSGLPGGASVEEVVVFHNPDGTEYRLRRKCANAFGEVSPLKQPPPPDKSPTVSAVVDCTVRQVRVTITDPDGGPSAFGYEINGGPTVTQTAPYDIDMSALNQYNLHTLRVHSKGVAPPGGTVGGDVYAAPDPISYGTGPSRACQDRDFSMTLTASSSAMPPGEEEAPTGAVFDTGLNANYSPPEAGPGNGVKLTSTRRFFIRRYGSGVENGLAPNPITDNNGGSAFTNRNYNDSRSPLPAYAVGDKVCGSITVEPAAGKVDLAGNVTATTLASRTVEDCFTIVTKPYFRVYGGDIIAGASMFGNSCMPNPSGTILAYNRGDGSGSAAQLAVLAMDRIEEFTSATGRTASPTAPRGLSLANDNPGAAPMGGNMDYAPCNKDYYASMSLGTPAALGPSVNANSFAGGSYARTGNLRLTGGPGTISAGEKIVLYVQGNVLIDQDITYDGAGWTDPRLVPSFYLVVKGDIYIHGNVGQLDGTYIAQPDGLDGGRIFTCADRQGNDPKAVELTNANYDFTDFCDKQLVVNGTFTAKRVHLLRTVGSLRNSSPGEAPNSTTIAEVFSFSPEAWLHEGPISGGSYSANYDSITSPPPIL